jgi:hypothetical protein
MLKMGNGGIELVNYWCMGTWSVFFYTHIYIYCISKGDVVVVVVVSELVYGTFARNSDI